MKKFTLSSLLLILSLIVSATVVEKTYYFQKPKIVTQGKYNIIQFENTLSSGLAGEPTLPYQAVSLLLPPGEVITNIDYVFEEEVLLKGDFSLFPYQPAVPLSVGGGEFIIQEQVYLRENSYPETVTGKYSTEFMNGHGFALTSFTPLRYVPLSGSVSYFKKVTVKITTEVSEKGLKALENLRSSAGIEKRITGFAQNPSAIKAYPIKGRSANDYRYLIITADQFTDDFAELETYYFNRGVKTQLVTTEYIAANVGGDDLQEKMRNYIIEQYQDFGCEFVLLGGDVEHVPFRGFYCYVQSGSGYSDNGIPADLYYSALDGSWNEDGDNSWGEPEEDDLLPEIAVARFPFSNVSELENHIHKSMMYQSSPVEGELRHALMAGEHLYSGPDTWGNDYLELLIGSHDDNGYSTVGIPEDYDFTKLYEEYQGWSGSQLMNEINDGKQFVHHVGHASETYVAYLNNSDITNNNFSGANGVDHNYMLLQTHGCNCGNFEFSDCILEKMVNIENCAVAVVGNSRYGWFNEGQTEGPAAHLHREMVDAMYFEKLNHIGQAFVEAKIQTAPWVEAAGQWEEGALRWNFYDINILGDPALAVWTDEPIDITVSYDQQIPIGVPDMSVTVMSGGSPMENFSCAILFNDMIYGWGLTDANGQLQLTFDEAFTEVGDAELVVFGYNCIEQSFPVQIIPNEGAYVVFDSFTINDNTGNNNGLPDCGENILLGMSLENVGSQTAENVSASISTSDPYITITDNSEGFGDINSGETVDIQDAYAFEIANNVPDQQLVVFNMAINGEADTWNSTFQLVVNAPLLEVGTLIINDASGGNGNGLLDPGESAEIIIQSMNNGHDNCIDAMATLNTSNNYISILNTSINLGDIEAGNEVNAVFEVEVDEAAPIGTFVDLDYSFSAGAYNASKLFYISVGLIVEDFETGDFSQFDWEVNGNSPWFVSNTNPYEGVYCAKSGDISDEQSSEITVEMEVMADDEISFYFKVSSEEGWDYLRFYIDGSLQDEWSGEIDWQQVSYDVTGGNHEFKWAYEKDWSVSNGQDCAWLDYIVFPSSALFIGVEEMDVLNNSVFPNPSNGRVTLRTEVPFNEIRVYDVLGNVVWRSTEIYVPGQEISMDFSDLNKGLYLMELASPENKWIEKIIIQ